MDSYRVIIAGGRDFRPTPKHYYNINNLLRNKIADQTLELVTGCAKGADQIPYYFQNHLGIPIKEFPADWDKQGKKAGILRNIAMAKYANALIAFDTGGKGTAHMIREAEKRGLKIKVYNCQTT